MGVSIEQLDQAVPLDVVQLEGRRTREVHEVRGNRMRQIAEIHEMGHMEYPDGELFMGTGLLYRLHYIALQGQDDGECLFYLHEQLPPLRISYREGRVRVGRVITEFTREAYVSRLTIANRRRLERHLHQLVTEASPTGAQLLANTLMIRQDQSSAHHLDAHGGSRLCNAIKLFEFCLLVKYEKILGENFNPFGMHSIPTGNQTFPMVNMNLGNMRDGDQNHRHVTYATVKTLLRMVGAENAIELNENGITGIGK